MTLSFHFTFYLINLDNCLADYKNLLMYPGGPGKVVNLV